VFSFFSTFFIAEQENDDDEEGEERGVGEWGWNDRGGGRRHGRRAHEKNRRAAALPRRGGRPCAFRGGRGLCMGVRGRGRGGDGYSNGSTEIQCSSAMHNGKQKKTWHAGRAMCVMRTMGVHLCALERRRGILIVVSMCTGCRHASCLVSSCRWSTDVLSVLGVCPPCPSARQIISSPTDLALVSSIHSL
jgi:hypothetical protein